MNIASLLFESSYRIIFILNLNNSASISTLLKFGILQETSLGVIFHCPMEETMTILHFENNPKRINVHEEMEITKATTSDHMLNITRTPTRSTAC